MFKKLQLKININYKKNKIALSNFVYENDKKIVKIYNKNSFNKIYGNQEKKILEFIEEIKIIKKRKNYIEMEKIPHTIFNTEKATNEQIIKIAKKIRDLHDKYDLQDIKKIKTPNFKKTWIFLNDIPNMPKFKSENKIFKKAMNILEEDLVLANNDIVDGNILFYKDKVIIIDFEYGGKNSLYFDLAGFIVKRKLSKEQEEIFLKEYFKFKQLDEKKLKISKMFFAFFWSKWAYYKFEETNSPIYKEISSWLSERGG